MVTIITIIFYKLQKLNKVVIIRTIVMTSSVAVVIFSEFITFYLIVTFDCYVTFVGSLTHTCMCGYGLYKGISCYVVNVEVYHFHGAKYYLVKCINYMNYYVNAKLLLVSLKQSATNSQSINQFYSGNTKYIIHNIYIALYITICTNMT